MNSTGSDNVELLTSADYAMNSEDLEKITKALLNSSSITYETVPGDAEMPKIPDTTFSLNSFTSVPTEPFIEIIEQPRSRGLRFRYECEGRNAGSIPGETSTATEKTFPTIQIHNHAGSAVVVVSCVTKENKPKPHPHSLVGKDCDQGICTVKVKRANMQLTFPGIGIQCSKKKDLEAQLEKREKIRVDPFQTGFNHKKGPIDLTAVRLCFQAFLPDGKGRFTKILTPVVSQPIFDKKAINELNICRCDKQAGYVNGGEEVFIFTDKINKDDIEIHFYEEDQDGISWEGFGNFGASDVHKQVAVVFTTPPYKNQNITNPVVVNLELRRPSDGVVSESRKFTYIPLTIDTTGSKKRKFANEDLIEQFTGKQTKQETGTAKDQLRDFIGRKSTQVQYVKQEDVPQSACAVQQGQVGQYQQNPLPQTSLLGDPNTNQYYELAMLTENDPNLPHMNSFLNELNFQSDELYAVGANENVSSELPPDLAQLQRQLNSMNQ